MKTIILILTIVCLIIEVVKAEKDNKWDDKTSGIIAWICVIILLTTT